MLRRRLAPLLLLSPCLHAATVRADQPLPPTGAPGLATARFSLPRVGPTAPLLSVTLRNEGPTPLRLTKLADACFVARWLSIAVKDARGKALIPARCELPDEGRAEMVIEPGREGKLTVSLGKVFPSLRPGSYEFYVGWALAAPGDAAQFTVASSSLDNTRFTIGKPVTVLTIQRGATVNLPDGAQLTFSGHSHKDVDERSAPGPLVVGGSFAPPGGRAEHFYASVFVETSRMFWLRDAYAFELVDYVYGESMRLRYYGNLH